MTGEAIKMIQLKKNEKILGFIVFLLLFLYIFNTYIVSTLREKFNSTETDITRSQMLLRKYSGLEKQRPVFLKEYKKIERYLNFKGSDDVKMATLLSKIESEARNAGITIVDMKPEVTQRPKIPPIVYRIQLNAEGDMTKIVNFIYNLENTDILFKIDKLTLSVKDEDTGIIKLDAKILGVSIS